jgi:RNA polymerase sigma-70 factor (TIGR02960 family)
MTFARLGCHGSFTVGLVAMTLVESGVYISVAAIEARSSAWKHRWGATEASVTVLDDSAFAAHLERHRREIHVHCYRMVGSMDDADELVQETLTRAWRHRSSFAQRSSVRVWLYRIATNACLDFLEHSSRRVVPASDGLPSPAEAPWLQPYPDRLLDQLGPGSAEPEAAVVAKETIELILLAAIQLLPPSQRAVLILRDVLGWSAAETAAVMSCACCECAAARSRTSQRSRNHGSSRPSGSRRRCDRRRAPPMPRAGWAGFRLIPAAGGRRGAERRIPLRRI